MDRVGRAFRAVPRRDYLPPDQQQYAARDAPLPIGSGVTNSQPTTVRNMLALLGVQPGQHVLDVGCGSGWTTALLAWLAGPSGSVVGVERIPAVLAMCKANVGNPNVTLHLAEPHTLGWPPAAPYDRILVSAEASRLPRQLLVQLTADGVMVVPVAGEMLRVTRTEVQRHGRYSFVPLIED